jgi:hypothetical protein
MSVWLPWFLEQLRGGFFYGNISHLGNGKPITNEDIFLIHLGLYEYK